MLIGIRAVKLIDRKHIIVEIYELAKKKAVIHVSG